MAGNTKLRGFAPGGIVVLERWGGQADFKVSDESLESIRYACTHILPKKPLEPKGRPGSVALYDERRGCAEVTLSIEDTKKVARVLRQGCYYIQEHGTGEECADPAKWLQELLDGIVKQHENYINPKGEPGVEDD